MEKTGKALVGGCDSGDARWTGGRAGSSAAGRGTAGRRRWAREKGEGGREAGKAGEKERGWRGREERKKAAQAEAADGDGWRDQ